jgi:ketosteroid isomerase-like protein
MALALSACGGRSPTSASPANPAVTSPPAPGATSPSARSSESPIPTESPIPVESNPPGDIPDNAAFVPFTSKAGGFTISTPEGWARTTTAKSLTFTDKLNTVVVSWTNAATAPTVASVKRKEIPQLASTERAFKLVSITTATLPAGPTVLAEYQANSEPNAVTGKQYRLDVQRYVLFRNGREIAIGLRSPVGSDNVDPWRIVTESFRWS